MSLAGAALGGAHAANYTLSLAGAPTTTATITAAPATAVTLGGTLAANDRAYDGTAVATGSAAGLTLAGVTGGDQVSVPDVEADADRRRVDPLRHRAQHARRMGEGVGAGEDRRKVLEGDRHPEALGVPGDRGERASLG